jgi:hypothetical protein
MKRNRQSGSILLESAMFLPIVLALLVGTVELARLTYTFHTLQKVMYGMAKYLGTQQGVNFCDPADPAIVAAENFALTGSSDSAENPAVNGLTPDMFQIRIERYDPVAQSLTICDCSVTGCDASQGGLAPDFIVVSLTNGYSMRPLFFGFTVDPIQLRPQVRVPYGGT